MKFLSKKIYIILFIIISLIKTEAFAKDSNIKYTKENISNYFSGIVSANKAYSKKAIKHLNKVQILKNNHSSFNIQFVRTLILLDKFDEAISFSRSVWREDKLFFEADLLIGLDYFLKKDYLNAELYFERLNKISRQNFFFKDFVGNVLISWSKAYQDKQKESFKYLEKIPNTYDHIKNIQNIFMKCYFDKSDTQLLFEKLIQNDDYNFSRYNFFLVNYLLFKNKPIEAKKIIQKFRISNNSNLLLKQTEIFLNEKNKKITNFFNCKNPKDSLAEFFYIIANLYSSEKNYELSNFYLKISLFLNKNFLSNKSLLAENFYYQDRNKLSIKTYNSLKTIGSEYSWYASKSIAEILLNTKGKKYSINSLENDFNLLPNQTFEHYYELANFYKDNEYNKKSIEYYSLALKKIKKNHLLIPKILDRRGTSYERLGDWENAEKDLTESLKILPDQPHVLNYLGYSYIDRRINLDKALEMVKKAAKLRENDGYIIDSVGWAYYVKKDYLKAEFFLQRAVELLPLDPVINDHYADVLWMLNKNIQARYFWSHTLNLDDTKKELKDNINKKLIFGISKKI